MLTSLKYFNYKLHIDVQKLNHPVKYSLSIMLNTALSTLEDKVMIKIQSLSLCQGPSQ